MNLRVRLVFLLTLLALIVVFPVGTSVYYITLDAMVDELDESLMGYAARFHDPERHLASDLCSQTQVSGLPASTRGGRLSAGMSGTTAQCFDANNTLLGRFGADLGAASIAQELSKRKSSKPHTQQIEGKKYRSVLIPLENGNRVLLLRDLDEVGSAADRILPQLVAAGAFSAITAAVVGWFVARKEVRDVEELTRLSRTIAAKGYPDSEVTLQPQSRHEVGELAEAFVQMLHSLQRSREQQRQLIQDLGHDVRTPLTSIRTNAGTLRRHPEMSADMRANILRELESESSQLARLVGEMAALSSDEYEEGLPQDIDLYESAHAYAEMERRRSGREIIVDAEHCIVMSRPTALMRVSSNLIGNALKFSPPDKPIEIKVRLGRTEVRDYGPGIPPEDLERIFDRFYRSDRARSSPGSGLGLSIVRQIVSEGGGRVWAENAEGGGARFIITFPESVCLPHCELSKLPKNNESADDEVS